MKPRTRYLETLSIYPLLDVLASVAARQVPFSGTFPSTVARKMGLDFTAPSVRRTTYYRIWKLKKKGFIGQKKRGQGFFITELGLDVLSHYKRILDEAL